MDCSINKINFNGYDAIKLKGFYMQGFTKSNELSICRQIKQIAEKEHLGFFINQNGTAIKNTIEEGLVEQGCYSLPYWAQDRKAFLRHSTDGDIIMCNYKDKPIQLPQELSSYTMWTKRILPRGGNYFIGYKPTGEKWMIINHDTVADRVSDCGENRGLPEAISIENIKEVYDVDKENICISNSISRDLDMLIRPIGYPYVLVNSADETLKNIEKMHKKFPQSRKIYEKLLYFSKIYVGSDRNCNKLYECLENFGFKPIKIGGYYSEDVCFMNSIAFKNGNDKVSLISNSTQYSCPELEYLQELFEKDLREKAPEIENIYFVSGGKTTQPTFEFDRARHLQTTRFNEYHHNVIMDFLGERLGGVHCMTAEIPDFDRII